MQREEPRHENEARQRDGGEHTAEDQGRLSPWSRIVPLKLGGCGRVKGNLGKVEVARGVLAVLAYPLQMPKPLGTFLAAS